MYGCNGNRSYPLIAVPLVALSLISIVRAEVPPRSEYAITLEVPAEQAAAGKVYYITYPSWDTQVTFTSDTPLERITGTVNRVVGYVVAEMDGDTPTGRLLHAAFRLPVSTMDTGIPARNGHLQSQWFDVLAYPEITYELADSHDAKLIKEGDDFTTFNLTLRGDMNINGVTRTLTIPARLTFMPHNDSTSMRVGGDMLALRCQYTIDRSEFNVGRTSGRLASRVAIEIQLDQFLVLDSMSPEARLAQRPGGDATLRAQKFIVLMTDLNDVEGAYEYCGTVIEQAWEESETLNTIAWTIVDDSNIKVRNYELAMKAAARCNELGQHENPLHLDTLARVCLDVGTIEDALKWQRKAVSLITDDMNTGLAQVLRDTLKAYEAKAGG